MDATDGWVPASCTLDPVELPGRLAEFDALLTALTGLDRIAPTLLRLRLTAGTADRARDLAARESACCTFFSFDVRDDGDAVVVDVRVPPSRSAVLDALAAR